MKIDFYILDITSKQRALLFACSLIEKAHAEAKQIYAHLPAKEEAEHFDTLLWTYREDSFLPHQLYDKEDTLPPAIQIGFGDEAPLQQDLLINLWAKFPTFYQQFGHVIEIVFSEPHVQQLARERYKQYREQGFTINTYKLKANEI